MAASSSTSATPLLYSCIAHHTTILTEHSASASSNASSLASIILPKIQHKAPQKLTYTHGSNLIHYIACAPSEFPNGPSAGGLTFLVIAAESLGRRVPFGYLVEIRNQFLKKYPADSTDFASQPAYGCAAFNTTLKELMYQQGATEAGQNAAIRNVQREMDGVREIMTENIERVLERGERIDLLVDKTDKLGSSARDFRVRSRGLRRRMWWKNTKLMALLVFAMIMLFYILIGMACGLPGWSKCIG